MLGRKEEKVEQPKQESYHADDIPTELIEQPSLDDDDGGYDYEQHDVMLRNMLSAFMAPDVVDMYMEQSQAIRRGEA